MGGCGFDAEVIKVFGSVALVARIEGMCQCRKVGAPGAS